MKHRLTAIIEREGEGYVALCPELDIASQGDTVEHARGNLLEALELFFECAFGRRSRETTRGGGLHHTDRGGGWVNSPPCLAREFVRS